MPKISLHNNLFKECYIHRKIGGSSVRAVGNVVFPK